LFARSSANQSLANGGHALLVNACLVLPAMPSENQRAGPHAITLGADKAERE
jgi:hypothetical protein